LFAPDVFVVKEKGPTAVLPSLVTAASKAKAPTATL